MSVITIDWEAQLTYTTGGAPRRLLGNRWSNRKGFDFRIMYDENGHAQTFSVTCNDLYHMARLLREFGGAECLHQLEGEDK